MNAQQSPLAADAKGVLETLEHLYRTQPTNLPAIAEAGFHAFRLGLSDAGALASRRSVDLLVRIVATGNADAALAAEHVVYHAFVRPVEEEDHYERAFAQWREPMAALGRRFSRPLAAGPRHPGSVAFVFHGGTVLGHTEVLLRLLKDADRSRLEPCVMVLSPATPEFLRRMAALGVEVECYAAAPANAGKADMLARAQWLRDRLDARRVETAVWVSLPIAATFMFAMRVAPVQVFWSLKHHPVRLPEIDGYLTYGSWGEESKTLHGQPWQVCPVPLALDPRPVDDAARRALRARFPHRVLLGSLAREEKLDSRPFLESVARILERNPQAGFIWTGRKQHPGISAFFEARGLGARTHFVGWVDTALHAAVLDLFLETFPLGCGITGYQALAAGVPVLSYLEENTIFGMQYWSALMERAGPAAAVDRALLDEYPLLCARDPGEYVELASRMLGDEAFREGWREREVRYFEAEIAGIARYSARFFGALSSVAARKAGA